MLACTDYDIITSHDFTIMGFSPRMDEAVDKANHPLTEEAGRKELSFVSDKSSVPLFAPDTHQFHLHPKVKIG